MTTEQAFKDLAAKTRECEQLAIKYGMAEVSKVFKEYAEALDKMSTEGKAWDKKANEFLDQQEEK